jgi:hypothetical protein
MLRRPAYSLLFQYATVTPCSSGNFSDSTVQRVSIKTPRRLFIAVIRCTKVTQKSTVRVCGTLTRI